MRSFEDREQQLRKTEFVISGHKKIEIEREIFVRQTYPLIDYLEVYEQTSPTQWSIHKTGDRRPFATRDIAPGEHVHTQNLAMGEFEREYAFSTLAQPTAYAEPAATFEGILRENGQVGTRNYIGLLTSVNCSATVAGYIADAFKRRPFGDAGPLADYPNVDGVVALTHKTGCGMASDGEGMDLLRRTIGGYSNSATSTI